MGETGKTRTRHNAKTLHHKLLCIQEHRTTNIPQLKIIFNPKEDRHIKYREHLVLPQRERNVFRVITTCMIQDFCFTIQIVKIDFYTFPTYGLLHDGAEQLELRDLLYVT